MTANTPGYPRYTRAAEASARARDAGTQHRARCVSSRKVGLWGPVGLGAGALKQYYLLKVAGTRVYKETLAGDDGHNGALLSFWDDILGESLRNTRRCLRHVVLIRFHPWNLGMPSFVVQSFCTLRSERHVYLVGLF